MIHLTYVNFGGKEPLPFDVVAQYNPSQTLQDRITAKNAASKKAYEDQLADAKERAFYDTLRARLKLAGQVEPRAYDVLREEERNVIYANIIKRLYGDDSGFQSEDYFAAAEMIRYFFDVDALLYFVAPDWWKPQSFALVATDGEGRRVANTIGKEPLSQRAALASTHGPRQAGKIGRDTYLITEETRPAPMGASLGWLLQVDGDAQRNAFLNSPWVKAVLPIRPSREEDALKFLQRNEVAGSARLDETYSSVGSDDTQEFDGLTYKQIFLKIAKKIKAEHDRSLTPEKVGKDKVDDSKPGGVPEKMALPTEMVFARGFDPLQSGVNFDRGAFKVFSEWTEILPTDQVVATEYSLQGL